MGRLGDVLEVLFGPDDRFQTVRATESDNIAVRRQHNLLQVVDASGPSGRVPRRLVPGEQQGDQDGGDCDHHQ